MNLARFLVFVAMFAFTIHFALASPYWDVNPYSLSTSNTDSSCFGMRFKINTSGDVKNLTGAIQCSSCTADTAYLYNDSRPGWTSVRASCDGDYDYTFPMTANSNGTLAGGVTVNDGEIWTVAFDAGGAWRNDYSGSFTGNDTGNSSFIIYDCAFYGICQTSNAFAVQGFTLEDPPSPPAAPAATIRRINAWDNLLSGNTTVNNPIYTDILAQTVTVPTNSTGTIGATVNLYSDGSSTAFCRVTVNDTAYNSEKSRTNTADTYGSMYVQTTNVTLEAGSYAIALECRRQSGGEYIITEAMTTGLLTNITTSGHDYNNLALSASYTVLQTDNRTTSDVDNNATTPLILVADYSGQYDYTADGVIETILEVAGTNCTVVPRYGSNGDSGSVGGSCLFTVTNQTDYTIRLYGRGAGSVDWDMTLKEMVVDSNEQNQTTLDGESFSSTSLAYIAGLNLSLTENSKAFYVMAGITTNGSGLVTYQLRLTDGATQTGEEIHRNISGQPGVSIIQEYFNNLNAGDYNVQLWGACSSGTCDIDGGDLVVYAVDQLSTQVVGFTVSGLDLYDDTTLAGFGVDFNNITYSTENGSVIIPTNDALANFTVTATNYFNVSVEDWDTGNFYYANLSQGWITNVTLTTLFSTNLTFTSYNVSVGAKSYNGADNTTPIYMTDGTNTLTINVSNWYTRDVEYNHTAQTVGTPTFTGFYDSIFTIGAKNGSAGLTNFSVRAINDTLGLDSTVSTTNGSVAFQLLQSYWYFFNVNATGFSLTNKTLEANGSTHTYNMSMLTLNSFNLSFYNESSNEILDNVTIYVSFISDSFAQNYTTDNGTLEANILTPDDYTIRYYYDADVPRDYYATLGAQSYQNLRLYIVDEDISSLYLPVIVDQAGSAVANAEIKLLRYYIDINGYRVVEMATTDTNGQAVLRVVPNIINYRLIATSGSSTFTTTPAKLTSQTDTYTLNLLENPLTSIYQIDGVTRSLIYNNATNTFSLTWSDSQNLISGACLRVDWYNGSTHNIESNKCTDGASGSLIHTVTHPASGRYLAKGLLNTTTEYSEYAIGPLEIDFSKLYDNFGKIGVFLTLLVFIVISFMGAGRTELTVLGGAFALVLMGIFGFIFWEWTSIIGILIIAAIIAYKTRT